MNIHLLKKCDIKIDSNIEIKNYLIDKKIECLRNSLNKAKNLLNEPAKKDKEFYKLFSISDPFKEEKYNIRKNIGIKYITNAWLKFYEILIKFDLIYKNAKQLFHFDNASLPGSFILSLDYYIKTQTNIQKYKWRASSLFKTKHNEALGDYFNLYKNNPNNWIMNSKQNGDLTDINNIKYIKEKIKNVDLYTSDLGLDSEKDYNNQEYNHILGNIGQILTGLLILKKNKHMVYKQYTLFRSLNINILAYLTNIFKYVYIAKPITSKGTNSEIYIICKFYNGINNIFSKTLCKKLKEILISKNIKPILSKNDMDDNFIKLIVNIIEDISTNQKNQLIKAIYRYNQCISLKNKYKEFENMYIDEKEYKNNLFYKNNNF